MKKIFRFGIDKNYTECQVLPSIRFWHYEGHVGIQAEWVHWATWVVIGKNRYSRKNYRSYNRRTKKKGEKNV